MKRIFAILALLLGATLAVSGCSPVEQTKIAADTVIVDVRTPEEYSAGHLEGALNIDVQSPNFDQLIMTQPLEAPVLVYCRSGNRSAQAKARMEALGFTNITDGGSMQNASTITSLPIVQ